MEKSFSEFESELRDQGFPTVLTREWAPHAVVDRHSHPFDANALIVRGEMWLTVGETTRHLSRGDTFQIPAGAAHEERYGPEGATYWVGRRFPVPPRDDSSG
jgi:quercetin dioxygenase-like cupin family protein